MRKELGFLAEFFLTLSQYCIHLYQVGQKCSFGILRREASRAYHFGGYHSPRIISQFNHAECEPPLPQSWLGKVGPTLSQNHSCSLYGNQKTQGEMFEQAGRGPLSF